MATIGNVTKTNDGYTGELATIRVQCPIRFVANPRKGAVMCGRLVWVKGVSSALVRDRDRSCVRPVDAV
jgi:hypothetical protein